MPPVAREFDAALERLREGRTLRIVHDLAMTAGELMAHLHSAPGAAQAMGATEDQREILVSDALTVVTSLEMLSDCIKRDHSPFGEPEGEAIP